MNVSTVQRLQKSSLERRGLTIPMGDWEAFVVRLLLKRLKDNFVPTQKLSQGGRLNLAFDRNVKK